MTERISGATKLGDLSQDLVPEPDFGLRGYFAQNVSRIIESGTGRFPVASEFFKELIIQQ